MRPLSDLIDPSDSAWPQLSGLLHQAADRARVISIDRALGERALELVQVTTRSTLGALALETGGIAVDDGWLLILGADQPHRQGLAAWNGLGAGAGAESRGYFVVAVDVLGGAFAINGGALPGKHGNVHYFAPDTLQWEDLDAGHSRFVAWALTQDLAAFYPARWPTWREETRQLAPDQGISVYPFLWAKGPPVAQRSRKPAPLRELVALHLEMSTQLRT